MDSTTCLNELNFIPNNSLHEFDTVLFEIYETIPLMHDSDHFFTSKHTLLPVIGKFLSDLIGVPTEYQLDSLVQGIKTLSHQSQTNKCTLLRHEHHLQSLITSVDSRLSTVFSTVDQNHKQIRLLRHKQLDMLHHIGHVIVNIENSVHMQTLMNKHIFASHSLISYIQQTSQAPMEVHRGLLNPAIILHTDLTKSLIDI